MTPAFSSPIEQSRSEVLLIDLEDRLSANLQAQRPLRRSTMDMLLNGQADNAAESSFTVTRIALDQELRNEVMADQAGMSAICRQRWGQNCHAAGAITEDGGCLIVMRSQKDDDPSKPLLAAMRKAASQFSGERPAFIAVQFDEIAPADLMLPHVRRRAGLLSHALFQHYGERHVSAVCFSCFDGLVRYEGNASSPGFAVPNLNPQFPLGATDVPTFLRQIPDRIFADIIGAPLPAPDISTIHFDASASD
ncbi:hypothetical protein [Porphyrobacter sp. GA68]|uniref:hypothetical protein n=1 Tax=Porphyrobacter sp. GA68 TaxID=2883480 RepID=UPI001D189DBD|nr:hypothetical protein [Porphyrobacter sp. GA68]